MFERELILWLTALATIPLMAIVVRMHFARGATVGGTTLVRPWIWMQFALVGWCLAQFASLAIHSIPPGIQSRWIYFSLTLLLAPFVSVLGAKRPGARVWDLFIVFPMLLVLNWPSLAYSLEELQTEPLQLEAPALVAVCVVLIMMLGNYFGTLFTGRTMLWGASLFVGLTEFSSSSLPLFEDPQWIQLGTTVGLNMSLVHLGHGFNQRSSSRSGYDKVWLDFRDLFGILWAKRVMDRLNQTAEKEAWAARITLDGISWKEQVTDEEREFTIKKMDHAVRWLLRRFTDETWIETRLNEDQSASENGDIVSSSDSQAG